MFKDAVQGIALFHNQIEKKVILHFISQYFLKDETLEHFFSLWIERQFCFKFVKVVEKRGFVSNKLMFRHHIFYHFKAGYTNIMYTKEVLKKSCLKCILLSFTNCYYLGYENATLNKIIQWIYIIRYIKYINAKT